MKKLLTFCSFILLSILPAIAQDVTLSATVQDPNGQVFQWGTYTITFVSNPQSPTPAYQYSIGGNPALPVNLGPYKGEMDNTGTFHVTLTNGDNSLLSPGGSKWLVQACPDVQAGGGNTSPCTQLYISLAGTQDISTQLNAVTLPIGIFGLQPMATAYNDSEVEAHLDGTFYFRVVDRVVRCWSQGQFYDCLGSGSTTDYQHNGTEVASQPTLNFIDSGTVVFTVTNDSGNNRVNVSAAAAGSGGSVFAEQLNYLFSTNCPLTGGTPCSDIIPSPYQWPQDLGFLGPLPPTYPSSNLTGGCSAGITSVDVLSCHVGYVPAGDTLAYWVDAVSGIAVTVTFVVTDNIGETFTEVDHATGAASSIPASQGYLVTAGGDITVTVTPNPLHAGVDEDTQLHVVQLHGAGALDAHNAGNTSGSGSDITLLPITTGNAHDIILGTVINVFPFTQFSPGAGYATTGTINTPSFINLSNEITNVNSTGTYTPHMVSSTLESSWTNDAAYVMSFANTIATNFADPTSRPLQMPDLISPFLSPFHNANTVAFANNFGDTLLDWHVATPVNAEGDTTDYTNFVLGTVGAADAAFKVWAYVDCSGSVATVTPEIIYTTAASNSVTITGSAADCTSHAPGVVVDQTIRAKTATTIKLTTTHTGSPTWNTSAGAAQRSNQ